MIASNNRDGHGVDWVMGSPDARFGVDYSALMRWTSDHSGVFAEIF